MACLDLRQFSYQRRQEYSHPDNAGDKENHPSDKHLSIVAPNKASLTVVPETPPPLIPTSVDLGSAENSVSKSVCVRRCRKRCNRLLSSSDDEDDGKANYSRECITPSRKNNNSRIPVTIFNKLPASRRKKRTTLEELSDDSEEKDLGCTEKVQVSRKSCVVMQRGCVLSTKEQGEASLKTLCEMFPQHQRNLLEVILSDNGGNLDQAVSSLVGEQLRYMVLIIKLRFHWSLGKFSFVQMP